MGKRKEEKGKRQKRGRKRRAEGKGEKRRERGGLIAIVIDQISRVAISVFELEKAEKNGEKEGRERISLGVIDESI
ncbi:hypothetical protein JTB14_015015 [Gonioctena quinquepunctata]|nr:hypothetical protein JTB14_015015 [Gonioctena quinquepunctata]